MKQPNPAPKSGDIEIGKKPIWQLWAEEEMKRDKEYDRLLKLGYVTVNMIAKTTGWTVEKARKKLDRQCADKKPANTPDGTPVIMYLMPDVSKVSQP